MKKQIVHLITLLLLTYPYSSYAGHHSIDKILRAHQQKQKSSTDVLKCFTSVARQIRHDDSLNTTSKVHLIVGMLHQVKNAGIQPNIIAYNAAISTCDKETTLRLLNQMQQERLQPNVITYSTAISNCEKDIDQHTALHLLNQMQQQNILPNVIAYSAAISACEKAADHRSALYLLHQMQIQGLEPDVISYSSAISACAKAADHRSALHLLNQMQIQGIRPDVISYSTAISACELAGDRNAALQCFTQGIHNGIYLDAHHHYTSTTVDLNLSEWFTPYSIASLTQSAHITPKHWHGIPSDMAWMLLNEIDKENGLAGKTIITAGQHGKDKLTATVQQYLNHSGYSYELERGTFVVAAR
ncbi:MAG: hypothetical protein OXT67_00185 [Zetaproteobacteria bacterium]|nr:hypothetical protein [Zetaproteobacteria bacterium]